MNWEWIRKMEDQLQEELEGACQYIMCALSLKGKDPGAADMYYSIAQAELCHYNNIHTMLKNKIEMMGREGAENYSSMVIIHDYLDEKNTERVANIKSMMTTFKE